MAGFPYDKGKPTDPITVKIRGTIASRIRERYHASQVGVSYGGRTSLEKFVEEIVEVYLATKRPEARITHEEAWSRNGSDVDHAIA